MKTGLTTSVIMHAALIAFGLITLSSPRTLDAGDVEALPVDIVPIDSLTQVQKGDKKAPKREKSAPKPTEKTASIDKAQEIGDNDLDLKTPPTPEARPKPVEETAAPPPQPKPADKPKPEDVKQPAPKPEPVPATEEAAKPTPKQEVKPDPVKQPESTSTAKIEPKPAEQQQVAALDKPDQSKPDAVADAIAASKPDTQDIALPDSAPSPDARPRPPEAETAKAPEHKDAEKPAEQQAARQQSDQKDDTLDRVAALLNKEKPSGGGAKRSQEVASLGGDRTTGGSKLSQSEMDALRGQIEKCWNIPAGAEDAKDLKVSIKFKLDRTGVIEGSPQILSGGGEGIERAAAESARRAVLQCAPYTLPADKYDAWADVIVNFDPSDMF
jgi:colicin import membrane protein